MFNWWKQFQEERRNRKEKEADEGTFHWPEWHHFAEDGTISIKCSGSVGDCLWSGEATIEPSDSSYPFWLWIINEKKVTGLIDEEEFEKLKAEFEVRSSQSKTESP